MIKAIRGTRDLLPPETALWNFVEAAVRDVFRVYNFREIRTPIIEDLQLFQRSVGEETDIVGKEMFAWEDRSRAQSEKSQWLALRPENTAGVVRAYIENKLWERPGLQKFFYIGAEKCRPVYNQALRQALAGVIDNMCHDCQRRAVTNPLRVLDCKVPADQPIIEKLPVMLDFLDDACRAHFAKVRELLDALSIN